MSKVLVVKKNQRISFERVSGNEMQEANRFNYLGVMISPDVGMGRERGLVGCLREERYREREHFIQRSKTGVILKSCDTNHGIWLENVVVKTCLEGEETVRNSLIRERCGCG